MDKAKEKEMTGHMAYCIAAKSIRCKTLHGKLLLFYYCINANSKGWFFKSYEQAVLETGISESTIRRHNKEWATLGLLSTTEPELNSNKATEYQLHLPELKRHAATFNLSQAEEFLKIRNKEQAKKRQRVWREKHPKHLERNAMKVLNKGLAKAKASHSE